MSWFCPHRQKYKTVFPFNVFNEYTNLDVSTKKIQRKVQKYQHGQTSSHYDRWQRTKFRAKKFSQMLSYVRSSGSNFIDPEFQHTNKSIGLQYTQKQIKWQRVIDIVESPVYSNEHNQQSLQRFKLSNKSLQNALVLMARVDPKKIIELLSKPLSEQGIYEFKFFINGIVEYVVIDDYVPTYKDIPIFVGPIREKEVYPMLLQKALAKAFGSYENIPFEAQTMMEVLFCQPSRKIDLSDLKQKGQDNFLKIIDQALSSKASILLQSKNQFKVRNYGINHNELYQLVNQHNAVQSQKHNYNLYQIVSQNKLSSWNGKFSINDQVWNKVEPVQRNRILQQLKKNKSFCMEESDIPRLFARMLIFQNIYSVNKDWENSVSKNGVPSFVQFYVKKRDKVYIRCTTRNKIRQNLIIAQRTGPQKFIFIDGCIMKDTNQCSIFLELNQGYYIICVMHDWKAKKTGEYAIFLTSSQSTDLSRSNQSLEANFLEKMFLDYSNQNQKQQQSEYHAQNKICSVFVLDQKIGLSFLHIRTHGIAQNFIKLQIEQAKLSKNRWQVIQPYANLEQLILAKNTDTIIIVKALEVGQKMHFPAYAFKIKE